MENKWICSDCDKVTKCFYLKWINILNSIVVNSNRVIVECKHYVRETPEK